MSNNEFTVRPFMSDGARRRTESIVSDLAALGPSGLVAYVEEANRAAERTHNESSINLNPATNVMNPRAEALLSSTIGTRPSLGHPGEKYEMGLADAERIEVAAAYLASKVFGVRYAEVRVGSGGLANLYAFMATCEPGDTIIVPPASIGGHITHNTDGAAGLYGLNIVEAPVAADEYTLDIGGLAALVAEHRPSLVTIGGSLNLHPHPVAEAAEVAHSVGARLLFDAAHACGMFSGHQWVNPLDLGADLMTMSTYKSLGGPPSGLVITNDAGLAERIDSIAYPGLTANFDLGKVAALAVALTDWLTHGDAYALAMVETAQALAAQLEARGVGVYRTPSGPTSSHHLAVLPPAGLTGHEAALLLERSALLTSEIGLPDGSTAIRMGTPEIVRWGMTASDMGELADLIAAGLDQEGTPNHEAARAMKARFSTISFVG